MGDSGRDAFRLSWSQTLMNAAAQADRPIVAFIYLQILDLMTTLVFLAQGVQEGNPLIRFLMESTANPLLALAVAKSFAVLMGVFACRTGRDRVLRRANLFFAGLVVWNLLATIAGGAR
jgi:hypothetical protein